MTDSDTHRLELATFAGGCFWCMEPVFRLQKGVKDVVVGYAGGTRKDPSYAEVSAGKTGHREGGEFQPVSIRICHVR